MALPTLSALLLLQFRKNRAYPVLVRFAAWVARGMVKLRMLNEVGNTHRWHALFRARQFRQARLVRFSFSFRPSLSAPTDDLASSSLSSMASVC